jgi:CheY-like chemotaxis protein
VDRLGSDTGMGGLPMPLIAVVDDSQMLRMLTAATLRKAGYRVAEVEPTGLHKVVEELRELRPDLMVLDQLMPVFLGSSLVRACFEDDALAALKVVMLTAQHDSDIEHRMEKLGVHLVLHKPIEPPDLAEAVRELLPIGE